MASFLRRNPRRHRSRRGPALQRQQPAGRAPRRGRRAGRGGVRPPFTHRACRTAEIRRDRLRQLQHGRGFFPPSASPADHGRDPARPGSAATRPGDVRERPAPRAGAGSRRAHRGGARRVCAMSRAYLAAAIVLEICGTTSLKLSDGFTRVGPSGAVVLCYVASFALLALALRGIELSIAYAVWSGVGTAVVAAIGIVWFGETPGGWKLLCLGLIVLGVAGLHLSEHAS